MDKQSQQPYPYVERPRQAHYSLRKFFLLMNAIVSSQKTHSFFPYLLLKLLFFFPLYIYDMIKTDSLDQQQQEYLQMPKPQYYARPQSPYPQQQFQTQPEYQTQPQIYVRPQRQSRDENSCLACAWLVWILVFIFFPTT